MDGYMVQILSIYEQLYLIWLAVLVMTLKNQVYIIYTFVQTILKYLSIPFVSYTFPRFQLLL